MRNIKLILLSLKGIIQWETENLLFWVKKGIIQWETENSGARQL